MVKKSNFTFTFRCDGLISVDISCASLENRVIFLRAHTCLESNFGTDHKEPGIQEDKFLLNKLMHVSLVGLFWRRVLNINGEVNFFAKN